jgi:hypothetical protein
VADASINDHRSSGLAKKRIISMPRSICGRSGSKHQPPDQRSEVVSLLVYCVGVKANGHHRHGPRRLCCSLDRAVPRRPRQARASFIRPPSSPDLTGKRPGADSTLMGAGVGRDQAPIDLQKRRKGSLAFSAEEGDLGMAHSFYRSVMAHGRLVNSSASCKASR